MEEVGGLQYPNISFLVVLSEFVDYVFFFSFERRSSFSSAFFFPSQESYAVYLACFFHCMLLQAGAKKHLKEAQHTTQRRRLTILGICIFGSVELWSVSRTDIFKVDGSIHIGISTPVAHPVSDAFCGKTHVLAWLPFR